MSRQPSFARSCVIQLPMMTVLGRVTVFTSVYSSPRDLGPAGWTCPMAGDWASRGPAASMVGRYGGDPAAG